MVGKRGAKHWRATFTACALAVSLGALPWSPAVHAANDERRSDLWLKASLVTTYTLNQHLNPFDLDVSVNDGVVTLRGTVDSNVEKDLATELARGVEGVTAVDNQLAVESGSAGVSRDDDLMQRVNDANLTAKVKSQLLWNANTQGMRIDVDTDDGVVTLRGTVASAAEAELAAQIARNTSGVRSVQNALEVEAGQKPMSAEAEDAALELKGELSDTWVTTKVKTSLLYNRGVDAAAIDVTTRDGVVTLSGEVRSDYEVKRAGEVAAEIVGVREVRNRLQVAERNQ